MSDRGIVDFLATVPLLEGRAEADLVELARVVRYVDGSRRITLRRRRRATGVPLPGLSL